MVRQELMAVAVLLGAATLYAPAEELGVGDPAPKLEVKEFVKGDAVTHLEKGKFYVVEFWATWCGPCKVTIPHLTELQKKYKDVVFIGVSVFEQEAGKVKPFVEEMGEEMGYRVATDAVPEGKGSGQGAMAKNWMLAAGQKSIPTAFIVDDDGKIAWIGHPGKMDEPLEKIYADKGKAQRAREVAKVDRERVQRLVAKLPEAERASVRAMQKLGGKVDLNDGNEPVSSVNLSGRREVTDAALKDLKGLKGLRQLKLIDTKVTDAGLKELKELKDLQILLLSNTQVTDAGLKELKGLKKLQRLGLARTKVTDAGLKELKELKELRFLFLTKTKVTEAGVAELEKALPELKIRR